MTALFVWPHWGWGASQIDQPPKTWTCDTCRRTRRDGRHTYPIPPAVRRCTDCAQAFYRTVYPDGELL